MFQKIYADASDDVKRAMNKSFQESGGTVSHSRWLSSGCFDVIRSFQVLSTNWNEIGKEKTEVKPPDGMEWKKWD